MSEFSRRGFLGAAGVGAAAVTLGAGRSVAAEADNPAGLTVRGNEFLLDGKPFRILAGAFHYFRTHPDDWRDRMQRMRHLGLNTLETYVAWNFHQPRRTDKPDFRDWRDLVRFVEMAGEEGLKVIVRPGPYICAEWDFGGLPAWLLEDRDIALRCADPAYQRAVDTWFGELLPQLTGLQATKGGPIIAMQVENEYGSFGNDRDHLEHLKKRMRGLGVDSLLFCSNGPADYMLRGGNLPDELATVNFAGDPAEPFAALRAYQPEGPLFCTEFWDGWFDQWGGKHNTTDPVTTAGNVRKILEAGGSVCLYMAVGGTNFGWWAGANRTGTNYKATITSYDYDAPISESGRLTEKFHRIREVLGEYGSLPPGPLPADPPHQPAGKVTTTASVSLLDSLDRLGKPVRSAAPLPMEKLGQPYGVVHYRTTVRGPLGKQQLKVTGLGDRALVFSDGKLLGTLDRTKPDTGVEFAVEGESRTLDLLVEATGRVNYGQEIVDPKGISGQVMFGPQALFGWENRGMPLEDLSVLRFKPGGSATAPAFHRATVDVGTPADAFLALPGWGHGMLWLNGFSLGRYSDRGPQVTLYAPGRLWRRGSNELVVMEWERTGKEIEIREDPDLG
ncbi:beta-galactosidase [Streptomyces sp. NA04227]|uniref:glycoside hydrolase family 35 protein n=1 Tax=Streptomyces sp. NA04227 TaxID=2742136 RepID=UPI0020CA5366|nr:beta-galactosidase [Streptomyces sp. NA04227]